ncbi:protein Flattop isoform X1 [Desmodus rotundus]|uniref:protein Flattop isoform X1 n=1 Tax=Desmodus rotundus TaxID=9430 RepID=UPI001E1C2107|nr:protein Flattop isoform X1 [Desmodus rotundus]
MANYSANQYEKAFSPKYLQNWSPAKPTKEQEGRESPAAKVPSNSHCNMSAPDSRPAPPAGQPVGAPADGTYPPCGHSAQCSPRTQGRASKDQRTNRASPWGSFMGTWQMPLKIPPARVSLTSRSAAGAASLTTWIEKDPDFLKASNGLRPEILGKPGDTDSRKQPPNSGKQAASPAPSPGSPASNLGSPALPQSAHPSAGHTPGPAGPVSPASPVGSPCESHTSRSSPARALRCQPGTLGGTP